MMINWFDRQGQPLTVDTAAEHMGDPIYRIVARDIWEGVIVSTVWIGLARGVDDDNRPLIFETMVFGGPWNGLQWHWATEAEAVVGHNRVSAELQLKIGTEHDQSSRTGQRRRDVDTHGRRH